MKKKIVMVFFAMMSLCAQPMPPVGQTLLEWRFGVNPKLKLAGYSTAAGYDEGSGPHGGYPFDYQSLIPTKHKDTVDYALGDWFGSWDRNYGFKTLNSGTYPSGGEWYDVEALYLDNDEEYVYIAIITSFPFKDDSIPGNDANQTIGFVDPRISTATAFVRPGDLSISLYKPGTARTERGPTYSQPTYWHYDYGLNLVDEVRPNNDFSNQYKIVYNANLTFITPFVRSEKLMRGLYQTTSSHPTHQADEVYPATGDWYTGLGFGYARAYFEFTSFDPGPNSSQFSGSFKGNATYVKYYRYTFPSGHEENDAPTYVIEAIIPKSLFGSDITGAAKQPIGIRWTMGCRNDGSAANEGGPTPIMQLKATLDKKDWGDLPDSDGASNPNGSSYHTDLIGVPGPSHVMIDTLYIGHSEDSERGGISSADADGDDMEGADDDDGVKIPSLVAGKESNISVEVFNNTGSDATLYWFIDFNGDGTFDDPLESGTITVHSASSTQTLTVPIGVPVDADGKHALGARFRLSTNKGLDADGPATDGEVEDYLVHVSRLVAVGNQLFFDNGAGGGTANNGIKDSMEPPVGAGVNVELYNTTDTLVGTTTTDATGHYYFDNLEEGDYYIKIPASEFNTGGMLSGYYSSSGADATKSDDSKENGIDNNHPAINGIRSNIFTLTANAEVAGEDQTGYAGTLSDSSVNATVDFGFIKIAHIGDYFWIDKNHNGIQDSGEMPVVGGIVELFNADGSPAADIHGNHSIVTDVNGSYGFDVLPGSYRVRFSMPSAGYKGYIFTNSNNGNVNEDSDADAKGYTQEVRVDSGERVFTLDAGISCSCTGGSIKANGADALGLLGAISIFLVFLYTGFYFKQSEAGAQKREKA